MPKKVVKKPKSEPGTPQSPPPSTGGEIAADRKPIRLPNVQLIGQPGSNGGVHRGQDLVPRRDLVRRILERALWGKQLRAKLDPVTGLPAEKGRRVATAGAMVADLAQRFQRIAETERAGKLYRTSATSPGMS
jgi:hypothetical protein